MTQTVVLELLIKSGLIAAIGLAVSAALAFRPARERVNLLRVTGVLLILLPAVALVAPRLSLAVLDPIVATAPDTGLPGARAVAPGLAPPTQTWAVDLHPLAPVEVSGSTAPQLSLFLLALALYVSVAGLLIGRFVLGTVTLVRWSRTGHRVTTGVWAGTLAQLSSGRVRLVASPRVSGPLSWGLPPGVVLIHTDSLARDDQALAVLAHELAHVRRHDWLFLALSWLTVALFWFNPLVWWLHRELIARTEDAADAEALKTVSPHAYARTLLDLASETTWPAGVAPAALALSGDFHSLKKRIARVMSTPKSLPSRPLALGLTVAALIAVATPLAAVELTRRQAPAPATTSVVQDRTGTSVQVQTDASGNRTHQVVIDGQPVDWNSLSPEQRREIEADIANAEQEAARAADEAVIAQQEAIEAAAEAQVAAHEAALAGIDAQAIARDAEAAARDAAAAARDAAAMAIDAAQIARTSLAEAAVGMEQAASEMRAEGLRMRDPAHRASIIADNRSRGTPVTEAQLIELSRTLPQQADQLAEQAREIRRQSVEQR